MKATFEVPSHEVPGVRAELMGEHQGLERLFEQLLSASLAGARDDVAATWTQLERSLEGHLAFEEREIFPGLSKVAPAEVAALAREHGQVRRKLAELGVEVDLHLIRHATVTELVGLLRRHALREDALMYRWAEQHLPQQPMRAAS